MSARDRARALLAAVAPAQHGEPWAGVVRELLAELEQLPRTNVRREVEVFGELMEDALRANDHKGGWDACTARWLLWRLRVEVDALAAVIPVASHANSACDADAVAREAADVANFAMMIADVCRGLR